jgi:MFS family permease
MMSFFALLPGNAPLWVVAAGLMAHGLGAGLSLAPLHRASMGQIKQAQAGMAAGLYSLIRFGGTVLGPIMTGVVLQQGLNQGLLPIASYQMAYWLIAGVAMLGVVSVWGLNS